MVTRQRLLIAAVLGVLGFVCGCGDIASVGVRFTAAPLGVDLSIKGPGAATQYNIYGVPTATVPAGAGQLPAAATVPAVTPSDPVPATVPAGAILQLKPLSLNPNAAQ